MTDKESLRKSLRASVRASGDIRVPSLVEGAISEAVDNALTVFAYLPIAGELDPSSIVQRALDNGATVGFPRVDGPNLVFHVVHNPKRDCLPGAFGIREPRASNPVLWPEGSISLPALVLVPGLAFDSSLARIGRGKGFYDRFLSAFLALYGGERNRITLVGLCPHERILDKIPTDPHDIPVDCLWTDHDGIFALY